MTTLLVVAILVALLGVAGLVLAYLLPRDKYNMYSGKSFALSMVGVLALVAGGVMIGVDRGEAYNERHCEVVVPRETGLQTKFVRWNGCFVTLENGRTVPYDKWIEEADD